MSNPTYYDKPPPYTPHPDIPNYESVPSNTAYINISPTAPINQQPGVIPSYGTTTTSNIIVPPEIIIIGACPACRIGILEDDYTCLGIFCAIFFFPLGILCCLALKNRRCSNCGAYFG